MSRKHQVTIPASVVREAHLEPGDEFRVEVVEPGVVVLRRPLDELEALAGSMAGVWPEGWLDELRDEWA